VFDGVWVQRAEHVQGACTIVEKLRGCFGALFFFLSSFLLFPHRFPPLALSDFRNKAPARLEVPACAGVVDPILSAVFFFPPSLPSSLPRPRRCRRAADFISRGGEPIRGSLPTQMTKFLFSLSFFLSFNICR